MEDKKKIAVIGSGIAGLASAWLLSKKYEVTIYEKNDYLGGHTNTRPAQFGREVVWADTGFMVFNQKTYPNLVKMFEHLNVETVETDMSFGVSLGRGEFEISSDKIFLQSKNLFQPSFWRMLIDIVRFNKNAAKVAHSHKEELSLGDLLAELRVSKRYSEQFLLPLAGAIWSTGKENILDYPAKKFITFCENHGLLIPKTFNPFKIDDGRLPWYTVKNGAKSYVEKMQADMDVEILLSTGVSSLRRSAEGVFIMDETKTERHFDAVVCASHPNQTLAMLSDASREEQTILESFSYTKSTTIMHKDVSSMLKHTTLWPSWTYAEPKETQVELSYYMNRLQHIDPAFPVVVTLNPTEEIAREDIFYETEYEHPRFSLATDSAQNAIDTIQGKHGTYFAGAWLGHGFHEDGLKSALGVAYALGVDAPWEK